MITIQIDEKEVIEHLNKSLTGFGGGLVDYQAKQEIEKRTTQALRDSGFFSRMVDAIVREFEGRRFEIEQEVANAVIKDTKKKVVEELSGAIYRNLSGKLGLDDEGRRFG